MLGLVAQVLSLRALLTGEIDHQGDVKKHAAALVTNAMIVSGVFPASSTGETSGAMKEIWTHPEDFKARVQLLQDAAKALDEGALPS